MPKKRILCIFTNKGWKTQVKQSRKLILALKISKSSYFLAETLISKNSAAWRLGIAAVLELLVAFPAT